MDQDSIIKESSRPQVSARDEIIVRADEVDEEGVDISEISTDDDHELAKRVEARRQQEIQGPTSPRTLANEVSSATGALTRPMLKREGSAPPPPPRQPPPPAPPALQDDIQQPTDLLSLGQLRNLVASFPKLEPTAYAYTHEDTRFFAEELEEWFQYTEEDRGQLARAKEAFEETYNIPTLQDSSNSPGPWLSLSMEKKQSFILHVLNELEQHGDSQLLFLDCLSYIVMGVWSETTKEECALEPEEERDYEPPNGKYRRTAAQLKCITESAALLCRCGAPKVLYDCLKRSMIGQRYALIWMFPPIAPAVKFMLNRAEITPETRDQELSVILTTLYFVVESGRELLRKTEDNVVGEAFAAFKPSILQMLSQALAQLRWDEEPQIPFTKVMLFFWKCSLLLLGSTSDVQRCKKVLRKDQDVNREEEDTILTATPIDYHNFRMEITSKYPAYKPPFPLVPLETHNNTILPPNHDLSRSTSHDNIQSFHGMDEPGKSIFHQPVHIATPAPSPPPSPGGPGGKGGKKQNYQTNQLFPFLYPPMDSSSNDLGGKGKAGEQSRLVGKKWEGSDVPTSIIEAGELFASRMRMSRPLRQIWDIREQYIKFERGWREEPELPGSKINLEDKLNDLDLENTDGSVREEKGYGQATEMKEVREQVEKETENQYVQARLDAVEDFFRDAFPYLQSIIIVLLKVLLSNITVLSTAGFNAAGGLVPTDIEGIDTKADELPEKNINLCKCLSSTTSGPRSEDDGYIEKTLEDLNSIRTREVTSKAISAFLLLILKWFRVSHVLKFEYTTQLLLDSNYLPLALKYFALQDVDKAVDLKNDREDLDFFRFCRLSAGLPSTPASPVSARRPASPSSSEDEAVPPPIARNRAVSPDASPPPSPGSPPSPPRRPEVDELGYPTTALPPSPLTTYAPRFFHTFITMLRVLQKLTKNHSHRALLLVQYKSSTILRKALKLPQPQVRLYTLKLFKTQVPFCGRKWRQANMRVITAIYVFCRMGLRDEWISGGGAVEEWVESAITMERMWRGLVGFWLGRAYKDVVVSDGQNIENVKPDFFLRELEKMGVQFGNPTFDGEEARWESTDDSQNGPILEGPW